MHQKEEAIPAFPVRDVGLGEYQHLPHDGMTLRDYFAAQFIAGKAADSDIIWQSPSTCSIFARAAYTVADAMLEARK